MAEDGWMRLPPGITLWDWVEFESALIRTDGCTKASGAHRKYCRLHDLDYYYGRDARAAYRLYQAGDPAYWQHAPLITRSEADAAFRRGIQSDSPMGFFSPVAAFRWLVLKLAGGHAWDAHRAREAGLTSTGICSGHSS